MPEIRELFLNDPAYASASHTTEYLYVGNSSSLLYIVFSDSTGSVQLEWSIDGANTVSTDTYSLSASTPLEINTQIHASYCKFTVEGLTPPCNLQIQGFFF